jgi:ribosomal protein S18 acetylase RimI-like enzyme
MAQIIHICDVSVHPEYQGLWLCKKIVEKLVLLSEWHKKIILYSNPGNEGFIANWDAIK